MIALELFIDCAITFDDFHCQCKASRTCEGFAKIWPQIQRRKSLQADVPQLVIDMFIKMSRSDMMLMEKYRNHRKFIFFDGRTQIEACSSERNFASAVIIEYVRKLWPWCDRHAGKLKFFAGAGGYQEI